METRNVNHEKEEFLRYRENNNVDYRVFLKKNDFFETPYLEAGKTYITSLIKNVKIDYDYKIDFDRPINGSYKYYVVATIEANKTNNEVGNYWTKDYRITKTKTVPVSMATNYEIKESVDINYNKYNDILNAFMKSVGLGSADGILKVNLVVEQDVNNKNINAPLKRNLMLEMPLSKMAIEASIKSNAKDSVGQISNKITDFSVPYLISAVCGFVLLFISIVLSVILFRNYKRYEIENRTHNKLRKFLNTYDSIIVNVEKLPNLKDYNVINVKSFEELVDAHSEVRMPINYHSSGNQSTFLLFNDKNVYSYKFNVLKKELPDEK